MIAVDKNIKVSEKRIYQYLILLVRPTILGVIGAFVWYIFRQRIGIIKEDQGIFEPLLGIIGIAHGLLASMQIQKVNDQHQKIQQAIRIRDKKLFDENACIRISPVIKLLLAVFSLIFYFTFLLYPFASVYTGVIVVWTTMFILYLLWEVAAELDDPFHGIWRITPEKVKEVFGEE